jgi:hypothetical protein
MAAVRLRGGPGNPTAIGARVTVLGEDGRSQTAEVYAGGGYLSQSTSVLHFGLGDGKRATAKIRWPDGHTSTHELTPDSPISIAQP